MEMSAAKGGFGGGSKAASRNPVRGQNQRSSAFNAMMADFG